MFIIKFRYKKKNKQTQSQPKNTNKHQHDNQHNPKETTTILLTENKTHTTKQHKTYKTTGGGTKSSIRIRPNKISTAKTSQTNTTHTQQPQQQTHNN